MCLWDYKNKKDLRNRGGDLETEGTLTTASIKVLMQALKSQVKRHCAVVLCLERTS